jgi:hypothetical protein
MAVRLFLLRWLSLAVLGLPGFLGVASALRDSSARSPFFTQAPRPMPLVELRYWLGQLPDLVWVALAASALLAWLAGLFLTAGAVEILGPRRAPVRSVRRAVVDAGPRALFPNLRIAGAAGLAIAVGSAALRFAARRVADHGIVASWTGKTVFLVYASRYASLLVWASFVGALAFWCHVIVAGDRRRLARRTLALVPALVRRAPARALLVQMAVGSLSLAIGGVTLALWAQSSRAAPLLGLALWAAGAAAQSALWLWRVQDCCRLWTRPELDDLRRAPDEPWRLVRRLWSRLRRPHRAPAA